MKNSMKRVLTSALAMMTLGGLMLAPSTGIAQSTSSVSLKQPGYYRMQVGDFEVTALSDGTIPQDVNKLLLDAKPGEIDQLLKISYITAPVETSVNAYLIKTNNQLILVDAGTADAFGPSLGQLTKSLSNAGYKPEQIDAVLLTHIHPDHTGGLMEGDKMRFPNATIYVSKREADFWLTEESKNKAPEGLKYYYQMAEATVGPYLKAGRVKTFEYGGELFPGITPIASPGHTPGHSFYALESKGQKLVFWGDIMHVAAVQLTDPSITIQYDVDPKAAAFQRQKAFSEAAKEGYWVAGDHVSFPGIGHLRKEGSKYVWVSVNYSTYGSGQ
jgi:glyoxylase-like metal-dependent hydrolase (beta-lactamase superfamily II)